MIHFAALRDVKECMALQKMAEGLLKSLFCLCGEISFAGRKKELSVIKLIIEALLFHELLMGAHFPHAGFV